jgi:hypothetical protein
MWDEQLAEVEIFESDIDSTFNILPTLKNKTKNFFDKKDKRKLIHCIGLIRENFIAHAAVISQRQIDILDKVDDHFKDHDFMKVQPNEFQQFYVVSGGLDYAVSRIEHGFFDQILLDFLIDVLNASLLMFGVSKLTDKLFQLMNDEKNKHLFAEINDFKEKTLKNFINQIPKNTKIIYDNDVMDKIIKEIGIFDKEMDKKIGFVNVME